MDTETKVVVLSLLNKVAHLVDNLILLTGLAVEEEQKRKKQGN